MMDKQDRIYLAGHGGMVGSAIARALAAEGYSNVVTASRRELDLTSQAAVNDFFARHRPQTVIMAAARVGGIAANQREPAAFLFDNLAIQNNLFGAGLATKVNRVIFLGSSCIYPKEAPQPMKEAHLLTGPLEPTNEGYAIAKIAGLRMAQYFQAQYGLSCLSLMPCNLYGTNDHFDPANSHVLSALVRRFVDAVDSGIGEVTLWGTGTPRREFMHVDDVARAVLFLESRVESADPINLGVNDDIAIRDLAALIARHAGFTGTIAWDATKPDGMMRKLLDSSRLNALGFTPAVSLDEGIHRTITEYRVLKAVGKIAPL